MACFCQFHGMSPSNFTSTSLNKSKASGKRWKEETEMNLIHFLSDIIGHLLHSAAASVLSPLFRFLGIMVNVNFAFMDICWPLIRAFVFTTPYTVSLFHLNCLTSNRELFGLRSRTCKIASCPRSHCVYSVTDHCIRYCNCIRSGHVFPLVLVAVWPVSPRWCSFFVLLILWFYVIMSLLVECRWVM